MLGLDGTGKTSILYRLKHGKITESEIIPTVGFNCECIEYKRLIFSVWDVSGSADTRCFWRFYYKDTHALIFVVDSSDEVFFSLTPFFPYVTPHSSYITPFNFCQVRMEEAREELHRLLTEFELWECPLLVMANKTDLPNALPLRRITEILQLFSLSNRNWSHPTLPLPNPTLPYPTLLHPTLPYCTPPYPTLPHPTPPYPTLPYPTPP